MLPSVQFVWLIDLPAQAVRLTVYLLVFLWS